MRNPDHNSIMHNTNDSPVINHDEEKEEHIPNNIEAPHHPINHHHRHQKHDFDNENNEVANEDQNPYHHNQVHFNDDANPNFDNENIEKEIVMSKEYIPEHEPQHDHVNEEGHEIEDHDPDIHKPRNRRESQHNDQDYGEKAYLEKIEKQLLAQQTLHLDDFPTVANDDKWEVEEDM